MVQINNLRCACGSEDLASIRPGQEPLRRGAVDLFTRVDPLVEIGTPSVGFCMACLTRVFPKLNKAEAASA